MSAPNSYVAHRPLFDIVSDHETDMRNLRGLAAILYDALMEAEPVDRERAEGLAIVVTELVVAARKMNTLCDSLYSLSRVPA
ncbi:hypothetical protein [Kaistia terrae]|uniref:DUF2783 domain-containing protein n=1 Tax=Kaistia terrae TaxID=537017 RepID=A0ABW0Q3U4_9HYPH|nr:hypothetical protein [Kaistia terrae]MCX5581578.1 hypothetical protein [Kaistia terrae]